jgi:ComF family protein
MPIFENIFSAIARKLLPTSCIICETHQERALCTECHLQITANCLLNYECCKQCGISLKANEIPQQRCQTCLSSPPYFDKSYCLDRYDGPLQQALIQFKYQKRLAVAHGLALAWNQSALGSMNFAGVRYLLPVPLSTEKLCWRGFNQSWELAKLISCPSSIEKNPHVLMRHHELESQTGKNWGQRQSHVRDRFFINPQYAASLKNEVVIVFDDVMTSGATLNEIARILKDNGASRVINWALLRTTQAPTSRAQYV